MFWVFCITLLVAGLLAIIEILKKKNPQIAQVVENVAPYVGYIGIGLIVFAVINLFDVLRMMKWSFAYAPISTVVALAALVVAVLLGIFQSIGVLKQFGVLKDEQASSISNKLIGIKIPLGFIAILSSIYLMLQNIIHFRL